MTTDRSTNPLSPVLSPVDRRAAMALAHTAYARFADVLDALEDCAWHRPTDCTGWSVRDMVGHMVGAMRSAASVREMISQQREIKTRVSKHGGNEVDTMTQVQIDRTADLSVSELVAECRALVEPATAGGVFAEGEASEDAMLELDAVEFCRVVSGRAPRTGLLAAQVPF